MAQDFNTMDPTDSLSASREVINDSLLALRGCHSGATAPSSTEAYMLWADTTDGVMKMRNAGDTAWIPLWDLTHGIFLSSQCHAISGSGGVANSPLFVAPFDCTIHKIYLASSQTTSGSDGSNHWEVAIENATAANTLKATAKNTDDEEFTQGVAWDVAVDQNLDIDDGDVLQLDLTKVGSPTSLTNKQFLIVLEYKRR